MTQQSKSTAYDQDHALIERLEAESGCELPDLNRAGGASLIDRAQRLLDCEDPPRGTDLTECKRIADRTGY
jgi:hypothetical protein